MVRSFSESVGRFDASVSAANGSLTERIHSVYEFVNAEWEYYLTLADSRTASWPLMQSYTPTLLAAAAYLVVVYFLPKFMAHRNPVDLKGALLVYNICLVVLNLYIFVSLLYHTTMAGYSYICTPVRYTNDPHELAIAWALWWFYFSKCIEFADTIFFILRKKMSQVTFLHVYHHATMFPIWWIGIKWTAGGQAFFGAMVNSLIHVIMYSYYMLAGLGPGMQKYLWWKHHLTKLQLVQFVCGISHAVMSASIHCDFPMWMNWALIIYGFSMFALFLNFYITSYLTKRHSKKVTSESNGSLSPSPRGKTGGHKMNGAAAMNGGPRTRSKKDD